MQFLYANNISRYSNNFAKFVNFNNNSIFLLHTVLKILILNYFINQII